MREQTIFIICLTLILLANGFFIFSINEAVTTSIDNQKTFLMTSTNYLQLLAIKTDLGKNEWFGDARVHGWIDNNLGIVVNRFKVGNVYTSEKVFLEENFHEIGHVKFYYYINDSEKKVFCDEWGDVSVDETYDGVPKDYYNESSWCSEHYARQYAIRMMELVSSGGS